MLPFITIRQHSGKQYSTVVHWAWIIQTWQLVHSDYEVGAFRLGSWCIRSGALSLVPPNMACTSVMNK